MTFDDFYFYLAATPFVVFFWCIALCGVALTVRFIRDQLF